MIVAWSGGSFSDITVHQVLTSSVPGLIFVYFLYLFNEGHCCNKPSSSSFLFLRVSANVLCGRQ